MGLQAAADNRISLQFKLAIAAVVTGVVLSCCGCQPQEVATEIPGYAVLGGTVTKTDIPNVEGTPIEDRIEDGAYRNLNASGEFRAWLADGQESEVCLVVAGRRSSDQIAATCVASDYLQECGLWLSASFPGESEGTLLRTDFYVVPDGFSPNANSAARRVSENLFTLDSETDAQDQDLSGELPDGTVMQVGPGCHR